MIEIKYKYIYTVYDRSSHDEFYGVINTSLTADEFEIAYRKIEEEVGDDYTLQDIVNGIEECIELDIDDKVTI